MRGRILAMTAVMLWVGQGLAQQVPPPAPPVSNTSSQADRDLVSSMDKMNQEMAMPMTGNADQDFAAMMLAHHEGAVAMARVELKDGKDPVLTQMAARIIASQSAEIKQFKAWQAAHPAAK